MQMALVTGEAHAPIVQFLMVWWPLLVLVLAVPLAGLSRSFAGFLAVLFLALLIFAEFFNAPDGTYRGTELQRSPGLPVGRYRALELPSRMGDSLHYPDGRVEAFPEPQA